MLKIFSMVILLFILINVCLANSLEENQNKKLRIVMGDGYQTINNKEHAKLLPAELLMVDKNESPQMEKASSINIPFARKKFEGIKHQKNVNKININKIKNIITDNIKLKIEDNKFYLPSDVNYISNNEVNTLVFPSKILKVLQPSGQNREIIYLNDNKAMSFYFNGQSNKNIQFIVELKNENIISLHFKLKNMPGRVIYIPTSIAGISDEYFSLEHQNNEYYINLIKLVRQNKIEKYDWNLDTEDNTNYNFNNIIFIKKHRKWINKKEEIENWYACSNIDYVINIKKPTKFSNKFKSLTVMKEILMPGECTDIYTLSDSNDWV